MNAALAKAAISLIGVRYRLHGRSVEEGLDCVGLVAAAMIRAGHSAVAPQGYTMRQVDCSALALFAPLNGFETVEYAGEGDLVLVRANPVQPHLLIRVPDGFVHAHAGLRRVVFLPGETPWPIADEWRLRSN